MNDDDAEREQSTPTDETLSGAERNIPAVLELHDVFTALAHPRRRYLLYTLVNERTEEPVPELAAKIAAWEQDKRVTEVSEDEQRRVHVSLYHSHIPKLTDLDILEYREADETIVRAVNTEQVQAVLNGAGTELDSRQEKHARQADPDRESDE